MTQMELARAAEEFFHERIPLTRAMGVRVMVADDAEFVVEAPLELNYNHLRTGFGGSVNAAATLAGYGFLWVRLRDRAAEIVLAESAIRFIRPVTGMIRAVCRASSGDEVDTFTKGARAGGSARIKLVVLVEENGTVAAEFRGTFVAMKAPDRLQPTSAEPAGVNSMPP